MAWKSTADSVSSFSSRIETRFLGEGATENLNFLAASFWTGDGATENRKVFFGEDGASSSWTTGVTCMEINQCVGCTLRRAVRNRHRHAVEQASRRWRGGRAARI